ncbi:serine hydrolase [Propioniciclava sp.]|uniref:serine hydrolase n=1 Tax=Propioniciclava sp. TaxID=2038686 RepID=UPI002611F24C|nr:serine hydrolase [Propioniciclava sp.]
MMHTARTPAPGHAVGVGVHPHDPTLVHPEPVPDYLALGPAGELWSTPSDLVRLGALLAGRHPGILRQATLDALRTPIAWADVASLSGHGLGVQVTNAGGVRTIGHSGSVPGFTSDLRVDPVRGIAVAICGNATSPFGGAHGLLDAARDYVGPGVAEPQPDAEAASLAGTWFWGTRVHTVTALPDGRLLITPAGGREPSLFARTPRAGSASAATTSMASGWPSCASRAAASGRSTWAPSASPASPTTPRPICRGVQTPWAGAPAAEATAPPTPGASTAEARQPAAPARTGHGVGVP